MLVLLMVKRTSCLHTYSSCDDPLNTVIWKVIFAVYTVLNNCIDS